MTNLSSIHERKEEIPLVGAMWQAWPCGMGMGNSYLEDPGNGEFCLRMDDQSIYPEGPVELREKEAVEKALIEGKTRGHLFARKFHSRGKRQLSYRPLCLRNGKVPLRSIIPSMPLPSLENYIFMYSCVVRKPYRKPKAGGNRVRAEMPSL